MNRDALLEHVFPQIRHTYGERDTMLYGLGVGACQDVLNTAELRFVYEAGLQALPSMVSVLAHPGLWVKEPRLAIDWARLVHAEQHLALQRPLPAYGTVTADYRVVGIADKGPGSGALLRFEKLLRDADGDVIGTVESVYFLRGDGGCGSWGEPGRTLPAVPDRPADGAIDVLLPTTIALLYRLSGDYNPLHADPAVARSAGFERPILQGLCTYGVACQSLVRTVCDHDASRLRSMGARFTKPVYPGESLRIEWWKGLDDTLQFRCISLDRDLVVLDRGVASVAADTGA